MNQASGAIRPGGRTARTKERVHAAVRDLLARPDAPALTIAEIAARSEINAATIYRRWGSVEAVVLDVAVDDANRTSPLEVTGDLRADLLQWGRRLVRDVGRPGGLGLFRALVAAAATPTLGGEHLHLLRYLVQPRLDQFQDVLKASGTSELTPDDLVELVLAPVYIAALFTPPGQTARTLDVDRLVDNVLAVRDHRRER